MAQRGLCLLIALLLGCGQRATDLPGAAPDADDGIRSGSRLQARWTAAPGGARILAGWFDRQLGAPCRFAEAKDGAIRCLPGEATFDRHLFTDPGCETRAAVSDFPESCGPPAFLQLVDREVVDRACGFQRRVVRRGTTLIDLTFYSNGFGSCVPTHFLPPPAAAYLVGEEVPLASFVRATAVPEPTGDLHRVFLEAEDGAREPHGWQGDGGSCTPLRLGDGRLHCVGRPADVLRTSFADAACTEPIGVDDGCKRPAPAVLREEDRSTCPPRSSLRAVGQRLQTVFAMQQQACDAWGAAGADTFYAAGPPLAPDVFPTVDEVTEEGAGVRRRFAVAPGGGRIAQGWIDGDGRPCDARPFDAEIRCVPSDVARVAYEFADPACTQPLARSFGPSGCPPRLAVTADRGGCRERTRVYSVGAVHDGPVFHGGVDDTGATCTPGKRFEGETLFATAPLPAEQFPLLRSIEP